jgi:hypothetical protein
MDEEKLGLHKAVGICDDFLELGKDIGAIALVIVFVVLFFFHGGYLSQKLRDAGITKIGPFELGALEASNKKAKETAKSLDDLQQKIAELQSDFAEEAKSDPSAAKVINPFMNKIAALTDQATSTDQSLKTSLLSQEDILSRAAPGSVESGYIYAGQVDVAKTSWAGVGVKNISPPPATPKFQAGQTFSVTSNVYLRSGDPSSKEWHTQQQIVTVLRQGEKVEYIDADYSRAKAGGWFLWLKVKPAS